MFRMQWNQCLLVVSAISVLSGCGGGGGADGGSDPLGMNNRAQTLEDAIYHQGRFNMPSQTKEYHGSSSPYDLDLTRPSSGSGLVEVTVAGQSAANAEFDPVMINGHRAYMSDGSFIDFLCNGRAWVTFPTNSKKLHGTFRAFYKVKATNPGSVEIEFDNRERYTDNILESVKKMSEYAGYSPSQNIHEISSIILESEVGEGALSVHNTHGGYTELSDVTVTRIVRFADKVDNLSMAEEEVCGKATTYILPMPGFSSSGPSFSGLGPYSCWVYKKTGVIYGPPLSAEEQANCEVWTQEKGW